MDNTDRPGTAVTFAALLFLLLLYGLSAELDCQSERVSQQHRRSEQQECKTGTSANDDASFTDGQICLVGRAPTPAFRPTDRCPTYGP